MCYNTHIMKNRIIDPDNSPQLLKLLYGDVASAVTSISPRLERWSVAFTTWLESFPISSQRSQAIRAWELLFGFHRCLPWEIDRSKVESWTAQLASTAHTLNTIRCYQGRISAFYRFCAKQPGLLSDDPFFTGSPKSANPVLGISKPDSRNYQTAYILHPDEALTLLEAIDRRTSMVGCRDYAILLTLLLTGMSEDELRRLRWGQLEFTTQAINILAHPPASLRQLPQTAWEAIRSFLEASGRLGVIQPGDYIFSPLADPLLHPPTGKPSDWRSDRPISTEQMYAFLKCYAAWAGLDASKITYACLRHTAAALRLETGADDHDLQSFLGRQNLKETRVYIGCLGNMLGRRKRLYHIRQRAITASQATSRTLSPPYPSSGRSLRKKPYGQPGNQNGLRHGLYSSLPLKITPQDRKEALAATPDDELVVLRVSLRRAFEYSKQIRDPKEQLAFLNVIGATTTRIRKLTQVSQARALNPRAEETYQALIEIAAKMDFEKLDG